MTIKWLNKAFKGPSSLSFWEPPKKPAVYSIMLRPDPKKSPTSYRILYFGKSPRLDNMKFYQKHRKFKCWMNYSQSLSNLYIAFFEMPQSTNEERAKLLTKLIEKYKPVCNF